MISVLPISNPIDLESAFAIRQEVFVEEQRVSAEEEYDEFEDISTHFLARSDVRHVALRAGDAHLTVLS